MFNDFTDSSRDFSVAVWGARILIGAVLGSAQASAVAAGAPGAAVEASMLQLDLQNELILGAQLSPLIAACMDDEAAGGWVLPSKEQIEISDRAQQRKQRARERCSTAFSGVDETDIPRSTSEALRKGFAEQLQARMALEDAKKHARGCITGQSDSDGYQRCLQSNSATAFGEGTWPRWLALFVRYRSAR
ncbi:MAG: hypothetical protein U1C47_18090 [Hydrogenophaga sp.]|uniref:hypothetical protein n=1 Tax=Hydrogenophaga sp. TaxID=1904254 RepID=UPI00273442F1|nr:hypothetical protein [Hydrogenophaga sp.]MDP3626140.1 hypothetical protein [Hydrogenophaga sp.]MDZ4293822.1 hypothetical protein [Hydrogenophaga sp.]